MKRIGILAIDQGVKCSGWCVGNAGEPPISGHTVPAKKPKSWMQLWLEAEDIMKEARDRYEHHIEILVLEKPWGRNNIANAMSSAALTRLWWCRGLLFGFPDEKIIEVAADAWQSELGRRRKMGDDAWQEALLEFAEELGGEWGESIPKGKGKQKTMERCGDELSARGIWAKACSWHEAFLVEALTIGK